MIKIENVEVYGFNAAIRGMRNPLNSWHKSDSDFTLSDEIGEADLKLALKLAEGGSVHAKYRRMIVVYADITAPLYWWPEMDTYKVGTVANSCSRMHTIHKRPLTREDFSDEGLMLIDEDPEYGKIERNLYDATLNELIDRLNIAMSYYNRYGDKRHWNVIIKLLPPCYNQKRTLMLNYEVLANIYYSRQGHKLDEWHTVCEWIESLPYSEIITGKKANEDDT